MSNETKISVKEFLIDILTEHHLRGIHVSGHNIHAQCPFHYPINNRSAFGVSFEEVESKKTGDVFYPFFCQSCGARGDIIRLVSHLYNCDIGQAERIFRKRVLLAPLTVASLRAVYEHLKALQGPMAGGGATPVLPKGVPGAVGFLNYLAKRKRQAHEVLDISYISSLHHLYFCEEGRWKNRIIMPIRDLTGNVVDFNDRAVTDDVKKCLHRIGSHIGDFLYGLYENKERKKCIIVEGAFDLFQVESVIRKDKRLHDFGVVALMGTFFGEKRKDLITGIFDKVMVMLDNDESAIFSFCWNVCL